MDLLKQTFDPFDRKSFDLIAMNRFIKKLSGQTQPFKLDQSIRPLPDNLKNKEDQVIVVLQ